MQYTLDEPATGGKLLLAVDEPHAERNAFRDAAEALLAIAWNRGPAQTLDVDGAPVRLPARGVVTLMANQSYRFERPSQLVVWQFNRAFYCVIDHDREVSCVGLLFYGAHGAMVLEPDDGDARRLAALLDVFVDEFETRDDIQGEMLRMLLKRLIIRLTRLARATYVPAGLTTPQLDLVRRFNLLVEQHYRRHHRVGDYARLLHRSPKTLANVFARYGERNPLELIRERIAVEAKRLLRYTDRSAKQIANDLGFADPAAFSRFFRAEAGVSATEFRAAGGSSDKHPGSPAIEPARGTGHRARHGAGTVAAAR
jgi:AraC family transcriptional regulator, transcriptional activator of pobA